MNYRKEWMDQGFLVVRNVFDAQWIQRLLNVCEPAFEKWKRESSADSEPMEFCYGPSAWVLIHLNHPKYHPRLNESLPVLLDAISHPVADKVTREVFGEPAIFMQGNYYVDPPAQTRIGDWHRDCQFFAKGDEAVERKSIDDEFDPPRELHMHIPLVPTAATEVVPGSHGRWDTPEEHHIRRKDPKSGKMPGALPIQLQPGDLAFFHVNTLHRGMYLQGVPRRTIAVTFCRTSFPRFPTAEIMRDWKGYAAPYQPWFLKPGYMEGTADSTKVFFQRFVDLYGPHIKPEFLVPELGPKRLEYFTKF